MKTGKMTKLLSVILAIAITVISGVAGLAEGQTLVVDLTGSATATMPGDVLSDFWEMYECEGLFIIDAGMTAIDFNGDGEPDVSVDWDTYVLQRLEGAENLTRDYTYEGSFGDYSGITFKLYVPVIPVTGVTLNKSELTLAPGESETLTATVKPDNATNKTVTWSSSDETVATVIGGKVTAVAPGPATILATTKDGGLTAECPVTVSEPTVPVTGVTLNKSELTLAPGESETLTATVKPDNATNKTVTWSSSDEAVATVSDGKVTAVAPGAATILATTKDGGLTAECPVTVSEKTAEKQKVVITAKNASFVLKAGKSYKITLKDTKGNPVKGVKVNLKVNGQNYLHSTDKNGMASFGLKFTKAGSYKADISFAGNESYEAVSAKVKFTVPKMRTKIIAKNTSFKQKKSQTYIYKFTLKDSKNRPVEGVTVKLRVNGKTYSAKTSKIGVAQIKLKITRAGSFMATIRFPEDTNYRKSEKKVTIKITK